MLTRILYFVYFDPDSEEELAVLMKTIIEDQKIKAFGLI